MIAATSVILPTLNEEQAIGARLEALRRQAPHAEILVGDGGSTDRTREIAAGFPGVIWVDAPTGRARQMNAGAARATGEVLLFLHADTTLPPDWPDQVTNAAARPGFAIGAFQFQLDHPDWPYRLIEWGVRWRSRLFRLPYGDQALFTTARRFASCGGYSDLPLMEDVDLVRRLRRQGRLVMVPSPAVTSARRWVRNGLLRQTWLNGTTYWLYRLGVPPERLAQRYRAARRAIIVFCKYPTPGQVKTRLAARTGDAMATRVYRTMVRHTLYCVRSARCRATAYVFFAPPEAADQMPGWLGHHHYQYRPQCEGDLGRRMLDAFREVFREGAGEAVIIGTDCPGFSGQILHQAFAALAATDLVLGPTQDGGYYLIGLRAPPREPLFLGIPWSTDAVLARTRAVAETLGLRVSLLTILHDLDNAEDLATARQHTDLDLS